MIILKWLFTTWPLSKYPVFMLTIKSKTRTFGMIVIRYEGITFVYPISNIFVIGTKNILTTITTIFIISHKNLNLLDGYIIGTDSSILRDTCCNNFYAFLIFKVKFIWFFFFNSIIYFSIPVTLACTILSKSPSFIPDKVGISPWGEEICYRGGLEWHPYIFSSSSSPLSSFLYFNMRCS